jgi:hypothetical protein
MLPLTRSGLPFGRPSDRTSLDPHETNVQKPCPPEGEGLRDATELELAFRHSGWQNTRSRVFSALSLTAAGVQRLQRFATCGTGCWVQRTVTHPRRYKLAANYCHDRFCTPCCTAAAQTIGRNLAVHADRKTIRFLTLTKRSDNDDLAITIDTLNAAFRRLRYRHTWKTHVTGGAAFLEVKWNQTPGRWHAHLHVLIEGRYFDQALIKAEWQAVTGDSFIVDIRRVPTGRGVINYVAKYATKGIDTKTTHNPPRLRQAIVALHGRRTSTTFGTWRGMQLHRPDDDGDWEMFMPLADLIYQKDAGNGLASIIYEAIGRTKPWTRHLHPRSPPVALSAGV